MHGLNHAFGILSLSFVSDYQTFSWVVSGVFIEPQKKFSFVIEYQMRK